MLEKIIAVLNKNNIKYNLNDYKEYILFQFKINNDANFLIKISFNDNRIRYYLFESKFRNISKIELIELIKGLIK